MLSDLDGQRRKLEASRDKLHKADENIGMAMQVMKRMKNRSASVSVLCAPYFVVCLWRAFSVLRCCCRWSKSERTVTPTACAEQRGTR